MEVSNDLNDTGRAQKAYLQGMIEMREGASHLDVYLNGTQLYNESNDDERSAGSMREVTVKKEELLEVLKENRKNHLAVFEDALKIFREKVVEELEDQLERARKGERIPRGHGLTFPMNQTPEYDQAIRMLEMSIEDEIELSAQEFAQYVMDRWSWKVQFANTNSVYITEGELPETAAARYGKALTTD